MAKIIAAYIAHGRRRNGLRSGSAEFPIDNNLKLEWQRIFCLFSLIHKYSGDEAPPRMILIADHQPPAIEGRLLNFYLERLQVEFYRQDHMWRPDYHVGPGDYFVFDALEKLHALSTGEDQLVLLGSRALAIQPLDHVFDAIRELDVLFVEDSLGDMQEAHIRAIRERASELRQNYDIPFPSDAVHAVSPQFLGLTHERLNQLMKSLRQIFAVNLVRANRGDDYFSAIGELLAALLALSGFYRPPSFGLSSHAAAIPEDFAVAQLADVPVIVPGYGREPDIDKLFFKLLPDRLDQFDSLDFNSIKRFMQIDRSKPSIQYRLREWISG